MSHVDLLIIGLFWPDKALHNLALGYFSDISAFSSFCYSFTGFLGFAQTWQASKSALRYTVFSALVSIIHKTHGLTNLKPLLKSFQRGPPWPLIEIITPSHQYFQIHWCYYYL